MRLLIIIISILLPFLAVGQKKTTLTDVAKIKAEIWLGIRKVTSIQTDSTLPGANHFQLPTAKAVRDYVSANSGSGQSEATVSSFCKKYNVSPNAAFTTLKNVYEIRGGNLIVDTTVLITTNTTCSANLLLQLVKGGRFNIQAGVTLTINSRFTAHETQECFSYTPTSTILFSQQSVERLYPYWFGAKADGITDCHTSIQKCINVALESSIKKVSLISGTHRLTKGIVIKRASGGTSNIDIEGVKSYDGVFGTNFQCEDSTGFGLGIQGARAVKVSGILFTGRNNAYNPSTGQIISNTNQQWRDQYGRNSRYSPYSAIVIDPFTNGLPPDGGYPNHASEYVSGNGPSSNVLFDDILCRYFIVGISMTPSGYTGNGSEIVINHSTIDRCQYGVVTCQTQARSIDIVSTNIASVMHCLDGKTFGDRRGVLPNSTNVQYGNCKAIINQSGGLGGGKILNMYGESVYTIGYWDGNTEVLNFQNCEINFTTFPETGIADAASVLDAPQGNVQFVGGSLTFSTNRAVETHVAGEFNLIGTRLTNLIINNPNSGRVSNAVRYTNCRVDGYLGEYNQTFFSDDISYVDLGGFLPTLYQPGFVIKYPELTTSNQVVMTDSRQADQYYTERIDYATVTLNNTLKTATWTTADPGKYRVGDFITSYNNNSTSTPSGAVKACSFGGVSSIVGNVITCSNIPAGIAGGDYVLYLFGHKRIVPTHKANIVGGTNKLIITSKATHKTVAQMWPVGTRVYSDGSSFAYGVMSGLYVASVVADTIYLSGSSTATLNGIEVFSAPCRTTYYSDDNTYQTSSSTYRNVGYRSGDEIIFKSHPYRLRAKVVSGGFTPTVKMEFKPLQGTEGERPTPELVDVGLEFYNTTSLSKQHWDGTTWVEQSNPIEEPTIGPFNNTSTAKGLGISDSEITLHAASFSHPGAISIGNQEFNSGGGSFTKRFSSNASGAVTKPVTIANTTIADGSGVSLPFVTGEIVGAEITVLDPSGAFTNQMTIRTANSSGVLESHLEFLNGANNKIFKVFGSQEYEILNETATTVTLSGKYSVVDIPSTATTTIINLPEIVSGVPGANQVRPSFVLYLSIDRSVAVTINAVGGSDVIYKDAQSGSTSSTSTVGGEFYAKRFVALGLNKWGVF